MANIRPYGAPIRDAIKRGDRSAMESLLKQAKELHQHQGDLAKAVKELEAALSRKG